MGKGFIPRPKHNAIIQHDSELGEPDMAQVLELQDYFQRVNPRGDTILDVLKLGVKDWYDFGNGYWELVKIKSDEKLYIYHRPTHEVRLKEVKNRNVDTRYCVVSRNFDQSLGTTYERKVLPLYPAFEPDADNDDIERSVIHLKTYQSGMDYYGMPNWVSAILWAELEYRIPKYNQSEFANGFKPSAIIQMFGDANDDQAMQALDMLVDDQTGTGNQAQTVAMMLQDGTEPAKIDILETKKEGSFKELLRMCEQKIMQSEFFSDALLGNKTAGELGGSQQLRTELQNKYEQIFVPNQKEISRKVLQPIIDLFFTLKGVKSRVSMEFVKNLPVTFAGEIDINEVLSIDERRQILGYTTQNG